MTTGRVGWVGFPPQVKTVERMLLSQLPEEDKGPFMEFLGGKHEFTRSGEPVFSKDVYMKWKKVVS